MSDDIETVTISRTELADLMSRIKKVETANAGETVEFRHCNVCGAEATENNKCPVGHTDVVNHVGTDRRGNQVLIRQG